MASEKKQAAKLKLIVSDEKNPSVNLKPGMKLHVTAVQLLDPSLKPSKKVAARLCSGSGTCVALIDISDSPEK